MRKGNGTIDMGMRLEALRGYRPVFLGEKGPQTEEEQAIGVGGISPEVL